MVLSAALAAGALARVPLPRPGRDRQAHRRAGVRRRAARRGQPTTPTRRACASQHGTHPDLTWVRPSGAHVMRVDDVDEAGGRGRHAHAVRGAPARVRARARRHDERRGGQPAAEDARGAGALRAPDPADGRARAGDRDGGLALPARALRPAAGGADRRGAGGRRRRRPSARRACARLALGNAARARYLASDEGEALRAEVEALVRARSPASAASRRRAVAARCSSAPRSARERGRGGGGAASARAARARAEGARAPGARARARGGRASATAAARAPRCSTWRSTLAAPRLPRPRLPGRGRRRRGAGERPAPTRSPSDARGRDPRRLREAAERCEDARQALELNVSEDLALSALGLRLAALVGAP